MKLVVETRDRHTEELEFATPGLAAEVMIRLAILGNIRNVRSIEGTQDEVTEYTNRVSFTRNIPKRETITNDGAYYQGCIRTHRM